MKQPKRINRVEMIDNELSNVRQFMFVIDSTVIHIIISNSCTWQYFTSAHDMSIPLEGASGSNKLKD